MVREVLAVTVTLEVTPKKGKLVMWMSGTKSIQGGGDSKCKGLEGLQRVWHLRISKEASVAAEVDERERTGGSKGRGNGGGSGVKAGRGFKREG